MWELLQKYETLFCFSSLNCFALWILFIRSTDWAKEEYADKEDKIILFITFIPATTYFTGPLPAKYRRRRWA